MPEVTENADKKPADERPAIAPHSTDDIKGIFSLVARLTGSFEDLLKNVDPTLTITEWAILDLLVYGGDLRPFEASKKLSISRQHAWKIGKKLEKMELITVSEPAANTRAVMLSATQKGIDTAVKREAIFSEIAKSLTEARPGIKLGAVKQILTHIIAALQDRKAEHLQQ
ncbi:hypothetical protein RGQ15_13475 [Paracoccus sp. MBLB3053]|uniref:MarR family transcriptional regulator n=1 Tax=Paracoccus aurantius TaxID=3073814 RepID=A0ABU2HWA4_9RHOB|nr:hypothetical protein [Paracoccus sp. MBLB3053]MDS9468574.1 hypothetical protein [Paracoccus sp. MBLB3053]